MYWSGPEWAGVRTEQSGAELSRAERSIAGQNGVKEKEAGWNAVGRRGVGERSMEDGMGAGSG